MATITFLGAAHEVTGSCHLLESPAVGRVLLDCGMHQGGDAVERIQDEEFAFDPATIEPVCDQNDVNGVLGLCRGYRFGERNSLGQGGTLVFHAAGYILGSSIIEVRLNEGDESRTVASRIH